MPERARQLKAIVFSDVVDSSVKIFADELIAIQRIKEDLALIRDELQRHGGSLVKSLGDGLLATFDGPTQALEFVQAVVTKLSVQGRQTLAHRFGLHTGEIYADGDDILGQGVHLASRLQTVSPVNGVAFVRSTYELIDPRYRRLAQAMGEVELKGLPEPVQVFCLEPEQLLQFGRPGSSEAVQLESLLQDTPFEVVRFLGRSSQQRTLLLHDRQRDQQAVMKLIPAGPGLVDALQVEAACLDRLRHPRIPRVLDGFARAGYFCFVQEYIPGPSLQGSLDFLRRKQRLGELLRQVLEVLTEVHAAGLVHGDLHPANFIPAQDGGALFLVDFSLLKSRIEASRERPDASAATLMEAGRPFFSAPERARFGRLTPAADLYALGVSALSLYTGQEPEALYDELQGCWSLTGLEPEVAGWLAPLLEDLPSRRLQHAVDALRLLDQPHHCVPAATAASSQGGEVSKQLLHNHLVATYGPMVELLLESYSSLIPQAQWPLLSERLVAAGLSDVDVQQGLAAARGDAAPQDTVAEPSPAISEPASAVAADPLMLVLREVIGPIAELIWTPELQALSQQEPASIPALLAQAGVPDTVLPAVLDQYARCVFPSPVTQGASDAEMPAAATSPPSIDAEALLLQLIGPIGSTVWSQVAGLPDHERLEALESTLRSYGIDELSLADLRRQLEGG